MSAFSDPIADLLTRIRNAVRARHGEVELPASALKASIAHLLKREGYIQDFAVEKQGPKRVLRIRLKYLHNTPAITDLRRISRPGCRVYMGAKDRPRVRGGMGVVILSTSRGLMTLTEARRANVGGEVLCNIW